MSWRHNERVSTLRSCRVPMTEARIVIALATIIKVFTWNSPAGIAIWTSVALLRLYSMASCMAVFAGIKIKAPWHPPPVAVTICRKSGKCHRNVTAILTKSWSLTSIEVVILTTSASKDNFATITTFPFQRYNTFREIYTKFGCAIFHLNHLTLTNCRPFRRRCFQIFVNERFCIVIRISMKFVPKGPIDNKPALV